MTVDVETIMFDRIVCVCFKSQTLTINNQVYRAVFEIQDKKMLMNIWLTC